MPDVPVNNDVTTTTTTTILAKSEFMRMRTLAHEQIDVLTSISTILRNTSATTVHTNVKLLARGTPYSAPYNINWETGLSGLLWRGLKLTLRETFAPPQIPSCV